ncbi:MBL fold metallo-hydrolase [Salinicoccus sp. HZC-1]|uniref:MBL fold metallo-hydrolase n=1 Tax=Salinicoccus sp. HZC-1 TaxID=3385497 RepID=UPI00398A5886
MKITVVGLEKGFPESTEPASGYLVEQDGFILLLHAGTGVAAHVQKYVSLHDIHHIILPQYPDEHKEDVSAFMQARKIARQLKQRGLNLNFYGPLGGEMVQEIRRAKYSNFHLVTGGSRLELGPFTIDFHRSTNTVQANALRVTDETGATFVHTSDTSYYGSLVRFAFGVDLLIAECSMNGRPADKSAGQLAVKCDAVLTLLANLPHHGALEVISDSTRQHPTGEIRLAEPGMIITI